MNHEMLLDVCRALNDAHDAQSLLSSLGTFFAPFQVASATLLYLDEDDEGTPVWAEVKGMWPEPEMPGALSTGARFYLPDFPMSKIWLSSPDEPLCIGDVSTDERVDSMTREMMLAGGSHGIVIIPLRQGGRWVGLLSISWMESHTFSEEEVRFCESLLILAASAIENQRLLGEKSAALDELTHKLETIELQAAAIEELSTPVIEIWDDVLVLPIVGVVDTRRSKDIMDSLLSRIVETQSRCAIIDVTGVEIVDTMTADYLLKVVRAARLLGTRCVLTGLNPAVAQTLVEIGTDLNEVPTLRNLKEGLKDCLRALHQQRQDSLTLTRRVG